MSLLVFFFHLFFFIIIIKLSNKVKAPSAFLLLKSSLLLFSAPPNTPLGTRRNGVSGKEVGRVWLVSGTDLIKSPFQLHNGFIQERKGVGMWLLILFFPSLSLLSPSGQLE